MCEDAQATRAEAIVRLLDEANKLLADRWHWFQYHVGGRTPFMVSIALACLQLERISPDAPQRMLEELCCIGGREKNRADYDQLIQKLCEILVMQQISSMPWPEGTTIQIEGAAPASAKRVDCVVTLPDGYKYGFEVKAPAYLDHMERRAQGGMQLPARGPQRAVEAVRKAAEKVVLPRDNTVRDFLRSANEKFNAFKAAGRFTGILVIGWDDFIFEAISALVHDRVGLLTPNSYSRVGDGPELYVNVDAVILLRHLAYFAVASAERELPDGRDHCMHLGGEGALPNLIFPVPGGEAIPDLINAGFNALPYGHLAIANAADYRPNDLVMWQREGKPEAEAD